MIFSCFECGTEFDRCRSQVRNADACCSKSCSKEMRRKKSIAKRTKGCETCGEIFVGQSTSSRFCSNKCSKVESAKIQKEKSWEKYKQECEECGIEFLPPRQAEGARFCSYTCSGLSRRNKRIYRNGYYMIHADNHPNATAQGYVLEHRSVMEASIGRNLSNEEVVHHINLDKSDNRIKNLMIMSDSEHKSYHANLTHMANTYTENSCKDMNDGRI